MHASVFQTLFLILFLLLTSSTTTSHPLTSKLRHPGARARPGVHNTTSEDPALCSQICWDKKILHHIFENTTTDNYLAAHPPPPPPQKTDLAHPKVNSSNHKYPPLYSVRHPDDKVQSNNTLPSGGPNEGNVGTDVNGHPTLRKWRVPHIQKRGGVPSVAYGYEYRGWVKRLQEKFAKKKAAKAKAKKEKAAKKKAEKEKAAKEKAAKEKAAKEKAEKDKAEKDKAEKDKAEKDKAEKDKAEKDKAEKDKAAKEKGKKEKAAKGQ